MLLLSSQISLPDVQECVSLVVFCLSAVHGLPSKQCSFGCFVAGSHQSPSRCVLYLAKKHFHTATVYTLWVDMVAWVRSEKIYHKSRTL